MNENVLGKEETIDEDELPPEELKFMCTPEPICIDYKQFNEVGSSQIVKRNTDNQNTSKKVRDKVVGSSELMVVEIPSNDHVVNEHKELEAFNKRVDDFIAEFNRQIRLERQQTSSRGYRQILPAGRYIKAV
ncbi:hypothetical protein SUGI_1187140 [Cryptomeria japonica]|nr:hypothetical protein SUGI_1187140 [Cryptomeria japonica]